jgi:hypothetical protein
MGVTSANDGKNACLLYLFLFYRFYFTGQRVKAEISLASIKDKVQSFLLYCQKEVLVILDLPFCFSLYFTKCVLCNETFVA